MVDYERGQNLKKLSTKHHFSNSQSLSKLEINIFSNLPLLGEHSGCIIKCLYQKLLKWDGCYRKILIGWLFQDKLTKSLFFPDKLICFRININVFLLWN